MKKKIVKRFESGKYCFVCGTENDAGLHAEFFLAKDGMVIGLASPHACHQSYPSTVHGGVSAALLDDALARAFKSALPDCWSVTVEMTTVYKHPVPYDAPLVVTAVLTENGNKIYTSYGEILLEDGTVAVTATGKYFKLPEERLAAAGADEALLAEVPDDFPAFIEIPDREPE